MNPSTKVISLALSLLFLAGVALGQDSEFGNIAERQRTSTVLGGTGMFNTFSTRTLYRGEFNFALFWNNFDRAPGAIDINQVPFNFTVGLTNRWEMWVDWVTWQQTTSRQPFLLSGYQYNAVRLFGDPFTILGPPVGGNGSAAFFPGTGSAVGGILPALGRFAIPVGGDGLNTLNSPGGPGGPVVAGLGPAIVADRPNYFNDLPFYGLVDFVGFDGLGRPVLGARESANGTGDVYVGTKVNVIDPNRNWFSMALGGYLKIPVSREDQARARGRTSGEYEYGPIVMFGQEFADHRIRFYENVGYIHTGDISERGVKVLDLRDKLLLSGGASFAINKHVELLAELVHTRYVGSGTPSLQRSNPLDINIGARFYFWDGRVAFGGAYRRLLNGSASRTFSLLECREVPPDDKPPHDDHPCAQGGGDCDHHPKPPPPPRIECRQRDSKFEGGDRNGFVGFFSIGNRKGCPPPPVPVCTLEAAPSSVTRGDRLTVVVKPSTPGFSPARISYDYRWEVRDGQGRIIPLSNNDASIDIATSRLDCGRYTVTATVRATSVSSEHPDCGEATAESTCSASFEITEPPCPVITCNVIASSTTVTEGDRVTLRANASGRDGLSYRWSATGGRLSSTMGQEVTLNTTGVLGPVTVTVNVTSDRTRCNEPCPGASCAVTVNVREVPPPPRRPEIIKPCGPIFFPFNSSRINNEHKACLDEIALQMQQDPRQSLVIDGHRDSGERSGISLTRANNARDYLVTEKGVSASRITVRNFGDTCPFENGDSRLNRRVEFWLIPEGAVISDIAQLKRCAPGFSPRVITGEQPAPNVEPRRPTRRTPRRRSEPATSEPPDQTSDAATDDRANNSSSYTSSSYAKPDLPAKTGRPTSPATVLRSVSASAARGVVRVLIEADGAMQFKDFMLNDPARIVIDIAGLRSATGSKIVSVASGTVDRVRVGEPSTGVVRIVIDLKAAARYQVIRDGSLLIVMIGDASVARFDSSGAVRN